jgi:hypothetical protein
LSLLVFLFLIFMPLTVNEQSSASRFFRRIIPRILTACLAIVFADFLWFQIRAHLPKLGQANGSVHRVRLLAITGKGNKVEYQIDSVKPEEDVPCAHSLFPQGGNNPCWYVARHANDPIAI